MEEELVAIDTEILETKSKLKSLYAKKYAAIRSNKDIDPKERLGHISDAEIRERIVRVFGAFNRALTMRQSETLTLVSFGLKNSEIADRMCITEKSVKFHLTRVYFNLSVRNRAEAIAVVLTKAGPFLPKA